MRRQLDEETECRCFRTTTLGKCHCARWQRRKRGLIIIWNASSHWVQAPVKRNSTRIPTHPSCHWHGQEGHLKMKAGKAADPPGKVVGIIRATSDTGATMIRDHAIAISNDCKVPTNWEQSCVVCLDQAEHSWQGHNQTDLQYQDRGCGHCKTKRAAGQAWAQRPWPHFERESKLRWFGYVERPGGTVRSACDIQVDGRRRPGRPKMTWTEIEWERLRAWKAVTWTGAHWCGWCVPASACLSKTQRWWRIMLNSVLGMIISKKVRVQRSGIKSSPIPYLL